MHDLKGVPLHVQLSTLLIVCVYFSVGAVRDLLAFLFWHNAAEKPRPGYAALRQGDFFTRRVLSIGLDICFRPLAGPPAGIVSIKLRKIPRGAELPTETGEVRKCVNLGSYNYCGLASHNEYCAERCQASLDQLSASTCSARDDSGTTLHHLELESSIARWLGQEAAVVLGMGYATNSAVIPALAGPGDLVISDQLNHTSIVSGVRGSGAAVKVFRHNDAAHLESVLRAAIAAGQPRGKGPWRKIIIAVEGIYSMEGELCVLKEIVALKKKYGAYVYLDEAHSSGAMGASGRGVCEHFGVRFEDVDVHMGTFAKSWGASGGYIAGSRALIAHLRAHSPAHIQAVSMSPVVAQQCISALHILMGGGSRRPEVEPVQQLQRNANYVRCRLLNMGFQVLGDWDSPVLPIQIYNLVALVTFSRLCLQHHVAVVAVAFPAAPLLKPRIRICISALHKRAELDYALQVLEHVGRLTGTLICKQASASAETSLPALDFRMQRTSKKSEIVNLVSARPHQILRLCLQQRSPDEVKARIWECELFFSGTANGPEDPRPGHPG